MSNKFTGITSGGQFIPVYDKDTHSALSGKQDKLSAGSNIQIENNIISVTGEMGKVYSGEGGVTVDNINDKISLDASAQSAIEAFKGEFDLSAGTNISFRTEGQTVYIDSDAAPLPEYVTEAANYVSAQSGTWDSVTGKQAAGDYLSGNALDSLSGDWNEVSAKLDTTAFSDVSGSFLTSVPDTYLQNTDLTIVDNKITEISGVPLSAGDELPSGVMNTSALEYNAVQEISGYNGSAIAQYGAEKQWLVHDDTLVHAANSAQYALGVNVSAVAQLLGMDETVLWSGHIQGNETSAVLNEPISSFNKIKILYKWNDGTQSPKRYMEISAEECYPSWMEMGYTSGNNQKYWAVGVMELKQNSLRILSGWQQVASTTAPVAPLSGNSYNKAYGDIYEVIGIGRKQ